MLHYARRGQSEALVVGTPTELQVVTSTTSSVTVAGADLPLADDMKVLGVVLDRRLTFDRHVTAVARACTYHAFAIRHIRQLLSAELAATLNCSLILSRLDYSKSCVVWSSSQQYSASAYPEHCGEDRHTVAKKGTRPATAGTVTLASCSSTDRVQAGRTDIQDPSFINPSVPRRHIRSRQITRRLRSSDTPLLH